MVLAEQHSAAVREVDDWLRASSSAVESLTKADLMGVRYRPVAGWRVPLEFSDCVRRVDVMVSAAFPFQPPHVRLVDRPPYLTWPHVEADVNDRGNGTPPFRVKGTPVRACEGHAG
ncbi:hypothetical protein SAMN03080618_03059 [Aquamicrobium aerolatum DSM 21857]|uniref:Uncharacterized protein n=1 Tax=Aquamicrobium aerolatum DSM 21857 TaxID=1121003 RepID=A0A1I3RNC8_9HYPH|nr:hypothetical protein SAMN03080618_03059 [Aquamicrobium aerolatum DSM 21857]